MSYRQRKPHKAVAFTAALTIGLLVGGVLGSHILDQAPEPGSEAAGNDRFTAESWTSSLSDGDWQVSLSAEVRSLLALPETHAVAAMVPLGVPVRQLTRLSRRPVEDFATIDRFDGASLAETVDASG